MVTGTLVVELTLVKGHPRLFTLGQMSNPNLAWKKADIFKIKGEDVDLSFPYMKSVNLITSCVNFYPN